MAQESVVEELEQGVVLVALHDCKSCNLMWRVNVVGELSQVVSKSRHLVSGKSRAAPLDEITVVLSLDVNGVHFVLEEVAELSGWDLDVLAVLTEVDHNTVLAELRQ